MNLSNAATILDCRAEDWASDHSDAGPDGIKEFLNSIFM